MSFDDSDRPAKRQRLDPAHDEEASEITIDTFEALVKKKKEQAKSYLTAMTELWLRYEEEAKHNVRESDEINIRTGEVILDRGDLKRLPDADEEDIEYESSVSEEDGIVDDPDHEDDFLNFLAVSATSKDSTQQNQTELEDVEPLDEQISLKKIFNDDYMAQLMKDKGWEFVEDFKKKLSEKPIVNLPTDNIRLPVPVSAIHGVLGDDRRDDDDDDDDLSILPVTPGLVAPSSRGKAGAARFEMPLRKSFTMAPKMPAQLQSADSPQRMSRKLSVGSPCRNLDEDIDSVQDSSSPIENAAQQMAALAHNIQNRESILSSQEHLPMFGCPVEASSAWQPSVPDGRSATGHFALAQMYIAADDQSPEATAVFAMQHDVAAPMDRASEGPTPTSNHSPIVSIARPGVMFGVHDGKILADALIATGASAVSSEMPEIPNIAMITAPETRFSCPICCIHTVTVQALRKHMSKRCKFVRTGEYDCPFCKVRYRSILILSKHLYVCPVKQQDLRIIKLPPAFFHSKYFLDMSYRQKHGRFRKSRRRELEALVEQLTIASQQQMPEPRQPLPNLFRDRKISRNAMAKTAKATAVKTADGSAAIESCTQANVSADTSKAQSELNASTPANLSVQDTTSEPSPPHIADAPALHMGVNRSSRGRHPGLKRDTGPKLRSVTRTTVGFESDETDGEMLRPGSSSDAAIDAIPLEDSAQLQQNPGIVRCRDELRRRTSPGEPLPRTVPHTPSPSLSSRQIRNKHDDQQTEISRSTVVKAQFRRRALIGRADSPLPSKIVTLRLPGSRRKPSDRVVVDSQSSDDEDYSTPVKFQTADYEEYIVARYPQPNAHLNSARRTRSKISDSTSKETLVRTKDDPLSLLAWIEV